MDLASLITAVAGAGGIAGGLLLSRRGQKDTVRQEAAAEGIARDKTRLDETQQALDAYETLTERLAVESRRAMDRADHAEAQYDRECQAHAATRRHQAVVEERCRTQMGQVVDGLVTLRSIVLSEVAAAAADRTLERLEPHPHDPPDGPVGEIVRRPL